MTILKRQLIFSFVLIGIGAFSVKLQAQTRASWHQGSSPYRAVFKIVQQPNAPQAGIGVSVPVCGLGNIEGGDLYAFDDNGAQLPLYPLGKSACNHAIALVAPRSPTKNLYLYFGSKSRAPVHQRAFIPGLTVDIRTLPEGPIDTWEQVEKLLKESEQIGRTFVDNISLSYNPIDSTDAVIMVFEGHLRVPKTGKYTFMLVSDDAGFLFVKDQLLISRGGRHYPADAVRGENRKEISLEAGLQPVRCVVVDAGGALMAVVAQWLDGQNKFVLPPKWFLNSGKTELLALEPRYSDAPLPAFWTKQLSYMSFEGAQYTEMELGTYNEQTADWNFEFGAKLSGVRASLVVPGLQSRKLAVVQKRQQAAGYLCLPEQPPQQYHMNNNEHFNRYADLILKLNLNEVSTPILKGYLKFLNYEELNPKAIPICEALLKNQDLKADDRSDILLNLARCAAAEQVAKAEEAYQQLFRSSDKKSEEWRQLARECGEFTIFRKRDVKSAENLVARMAKHLSPHDPAVAELTVDLHLQKNEIEQAREELTKLIKTSAMSENQRLAAVKSSALQQRFYDLLEAGFVQDARKELWSWQNLAPMDRLDGSLALARSHLFQKLEWYDGALAVLDAVILLDPLLPNLPKVEYERAHVFQQVGETKKANELFMKIIKEYPNHPVAEKSKKMLK